MPWLLMNNFNFFHKQLIKLISLSFSLMHHLFLALKGDQGNSHRRMGGGGFDAKCQRRLTKPNSPSEQLQQHLHGWGSKGERAPGFWRPRSCQHQRPPWDASSGDDPPWAGILFLERLSGRALLVALERARGLVALRGQRGGHPVPCGQRRSSWPWRAALSPDPPGVPTAPGCRLGSGRPDPPPAPLPASYGLRKRHREARENGLSLWIMIIFKVSEG